MVKSLFHGARGTGFLRIAPKRNKIFPNLESEPEDAVQNFASKIEIFELLHK